MAQELLLEKIEAAKTAIGEAETELGNVVAGDSAVALRAEKVEASAAVRAAFSRLRAAKEKLIDLEKLVALAEIEAARTAIGAAEGDLDRALDEIEVAARAEKTWVTDVVEEALTKLRAAKGKLVDVEKSIPPDED